MAGTSIKSAPPKYSGSSGEQASTGGEGGQAMDADLDGDALLAGLPFAGRIPAAVYLIAALMVAALLVSLVVTPLNH
ncbi:hypothetical protein I6A60_21375 [Frankia sp. AgB1.9]|uniref:hypothetical protein n=1 Tax=unclassified Frankia TaxID=2632575 RepID=UPI0019349299|nr:MULTISPECIES: hypothetical protein [unclassified Frankia]MBL7487961.1 hypothetical protein [Frankia sp. AgW1.1]MBL7550404.1 hypothetical protein [Frankia sp. AgB1.9]MBL7620874.1 hypothetical protein [Frankia sp. AgB1.8]